MTPDYLKPPFAPQKQPMPGTTDAMQPRPDHVKRPGQPVELATTYVMLADPMSSYVSGATVPVTGGKPFI